MLQANTFILNEGFMEWPSSEFSVYFCQFNEAGYADNLFENYGITFHHSLHSAVVKRRAEYLAGRYCATRSLSTFGMSKGINIDVGEKRSPVWPDDIAGSISHSNETAIAVTSELTEVKGVGIDVEKIISAEVQHKIQDKVLSSAEIALLSEYPDHGALLFTIMFSIKESFFKAAFPLVKNYFDFNTIEISKVDMHEKTIDYSVVKPPSSHFNTHHLFQGSFRTMGTDAIVTVATL